MRARISERKVVVSFQIDVVSSFAVIRKFDLLVVMTVQDRLFLKLKEWILMTDKFQFIENEREKIFKIFSLSFLCAIALGCAILRVIHIRCLFRAGDGFAVRDRI